MSKIDFCAKDVTKLLPLLSKAAAHKQYTQHLNLLETLCKQVSTASVAYRRLNRACKTCKEATIFGLYGQCRSISYYYLKMQSAAVIHLKQPHLLTELNVLLLIFAQLPVICNGVGKKMFKMYLEMFFDSIFYALVSRRRL